MRTYSAVIAESGTCLVERLRGAFTFGTRLRGLMFRKELPDGEGLWLPDCSSVHTFFMRFPIDVVYLDAENRVLKIVEGMKPWRLSWCLRAGGVVEAAAGAARACGLARGDRLEFRRPISDRNTGEPGARR